MKTQVKSAARLSVGNVLVSNGVLDLGGATATVGRVMRARGRKPPRGGETLLVHTDQGVLRVNSKDPVRIRAER